MPLFERAARPMAVQNKAEMGAGDAEPASRLRNDRNAFLFTFSGVSCNDHESGFNSFLLMSQQQNDILTRNLCRALLKARGDRSQADFARYLGIAAQQTYQRYETGQTVPDGVTLHRIATRLGVTVDSLLGGAEPAAHVSEEPSGQYRTGKARMIPVISWAHAGQAEAYEELPIDWEHEVGTECRDEKVFGLELRGDSMEPKHQEGDIAIVSPGREIYPGELVVAKLRDNGVCFKIFNAPVGEIYRLTSYNPAHLPLELPRDGFHWIYAVYEVRRGSAAKNSWK